MRQFAELVIRLGSSTKTNDKLNALVNYFSVADDKDKVWVIAIFSGRRPKRAVNTTQLATYAVELIGLPFWLFEESYHTVGDLAETITLLLPEKTIDAVNTRTLHSYIERLKEIEKESEEVRRKFFGHQFFAAAPDKEFAVAFDQLPADAVPFPFCLPAGRAAQCGFELVFLNSVSEIEGVGL